jgi:hypothetical protein
MSTTFERITHRRTIPELFSAPRLYRAEWRAHAETELGLDDLRERILEAQAEMFVRNVLGRSEPGMTWRMSQLEEEMGLPDGSLTALTDGERRDRICARLRAWRLPTVYAIRAVALTYAGNDVEVIMDYPAYRLIIVFTGGRLPPNHADLRSELTRIVPAHLAPVEFWIGFLTWGDLEPVIGWGGIWDDLENTSLTWDELENAGRNQLPQPTP